MYCAVHTSAPLMLSSRDCLFLLSKTLIIDLLLNRWNVVQSSMFCCYRAHCWTQYQLIVKTLSGMPAKDNQ